jgi:Flp pilus assembly protein TadG
MLVRDRPGRRTRGSSLAEAAIVFPLVVLVTCALVEFISILHAYLALENGVSQATRYAVTGQTMTDPSNPAKNLPRDQAIIAALRRATPTVAIADSDVTFFDVSQNTSGVGGPNDLIRVTVIHAWPLLTPVLRPVFPSGNVLLKASATMKNEPFPTS